MLQYASIGFIFLPALQKVASLQNQAGKMFLRRSRGQNKIRLQPWQPKHGVAGLGGIVLPGSHTGKMAAKLAKTGLYLSCIVPSFSGL